MYLYVRTILVKLHPPYFVTVWQTGFYSQIVKEKVSN